MGIDVYLGWQGQTEEERELQYTGFNICCGHVGYLREAYHGPPYATKLLVPEGWRLEELELPTFQHDGSPDRFEDGDPGYYYKVSVEELWRRLPLAIAATRARYGEVERFDGCEDRPAINGRLIADVSAETYESFVRLAEEKQDDEGNVLIHVSY